MCSRSLNAFSSEKLVLLDTYYYLHPRDIQKLNLSGKTVVFLENQQLPPIMRALTGIYSNVLKDIHRKILRRHKITVPTYLDRLDNDEKRAAVLLMVSSVTKVKFDQIMKKKTKLKLNAKRERRILDQASWADKDAVKMFIQRLARELAGAREVRFEVIEKDSKESVGQYKKRISSELKCSQNCCAGKSSPDNEDLRLVMAIHRIRKPLDVYVIPRSRARGECFRCVLNHEVNSKKTLSHVTIKSLEED